MSRFNLNKMQEDSYICEECRHKADKLKKCCGKNMVNSKNTVKIANNICGCSREF